jgi:hypothetical protein
VIKEEVRVGGREGATEGWKKEEAQSCTKCKKTEDWMNGGEERVTLISKANSQKARHAYVRKGRQSRRCCYSID